MLPSARLVHLPTAPGPWLPPPWPAGERHPPLSLSCCTGGGAHLQLLLHGGRFGLGLGFTDLGCCPLPLAYPPPPSLSRLLLEWCLQADACCLEAHRGTHPSFATQFDPGVSVVPHYKISRCVALCSGSRSSFSRTCLPVSNGYRLAKARILSCGLSKYRTPASKKTVSVHSPFE